MESDTLAFLLLTSVKSAKVNPAIIPKNPPFVMLFARLKSGMTKRMPEKTAMAVRMSVGFSFSLKNRGSRNVTNKGKVENVIRPTATLEIWMERKKLHQ